MRIYQIFTVIHEGKGGPHNKNDYLDAKFFCEERPPGPYQTEKREAGNREITCLSEASFACPCGLFWSGHFCYFAGRMTERTLSKRAVNYTVRLIFEVASNHP